MDGCNSTSSFCLPYDGTQTRKRLEEVLKIMGPLIDGEGESLHTSPHLRRARNRPRHEQEETRSLSRLLYFLASAWLRQSIPSADALSSVRFRVVIAHYNQPELLHLCLRTLMHQTHTNWTACIVDDASDPDVVHQVKQLRSIFRSDSRFYWRYQSTNRGLLYSTFTGMECLRPHNDDIVVWLDGDDFLWGDDVLRRVAAYYASDDIHLTFGSYISHWDPIGCCNCSAHNWTHVAATNSYRDIEWTFSHLKTFRFGLVPHVNLTHMKDRSGKWLRSASDFALMYPLLELSGGKFRCIPERLYYYNVKNPLSHHNNRDRSSGNGRSLAANQTDNARYVRHLPRYRPVV
ncbi:unnamed protein product [Vitrella brassicaformis CCMP3155]|uniref:Glycosyltransferase 2-like domain-containing protein n=2 Tax=Vitrella brassicaformis TaxID=1169539 RepID=A0A0G4EQM4_VITBC|nr:unnamed protein product [Vitrella brassicaformis CCMP3155]|eukprot:CEL99538.1 unnamed protein product [Vitrella brassicaformis CCMP3155]